MTRFSRFERRILTAMAAVAVVPLLGSLVLGQGMLREAYQVGVNRRVRTELEHGLAVFRQHFVELRRSAEQVADAFAGDFAIHRAVASNDTGTLRRRLQELMSRHDRVTRVVLRNGKGEELARHERGDRLDPSKMRLLDLERTLSELEGPPELVVTVATPTTPFEDYRRAGELFEVYSRLEASTRYVSNVFLVVYLGFLLTVVAGGLLVGVVLSRRVTRRVAVLADATRKVGAGDLTVEVPADVRDEIGELTRSFNEMVRDVRESRDRIEYLQRIGAWQEFARRLAHEIKNPLTPIQLAMQEVHRSYRGDDDHYRRRLEEALSIVEEEVATLRRLVGEFSEFARLPQAQLQPADLNDMIRDASRSLRSVEEGDRAAGDSDVPIEIQYELAQYPLPVLIDEMMLKRCIDNLVRNALQAIGDAARKRGKATEASGSTDRGLVLIRTSLEDDRAVIEVNDNGPGVVQSERDKVFDPYFTTKAEGTGLGLAIVKKVVLEHKGEIACEQSDWGGASFKIHLPVSEILE